MDPRISTCGKFGDYCLRNDESLLGETVPNRDKVVSLFETHTTVVPFVAKPATPKTNRTFWGVGEILKMGLVSITH